MTHKKEGLLTTSWVKFIIFVIIIVGGLIGGHYKQSAAIDDRLDKIEEEQRMTALVDSVYRADVKENLDSLNVKVYKLEKTTDSTLNMQKKILHAIEQLNNSG